MMMAEWTVHCRDVRRPAGRILFVACVHTDMLRNSSLRCHLEARAHTASPRVAIAITTGTITIVITINMTSTVINSTAIVITVTIPRAICS